jgi:hypothetical protein
VLFSGHDPDHRSHVIRIVRDVVEVVAILAAGFWAFYVFIYENRIKPSFTDPQMNVTATLQKTSERNGAVGILMKTDVRNVGAVRFYYVGYSVTVLGAKMTLSTRPLPPERSSISESTSTYFRLSTFVPVYGYGFITTLGNPTSRQGGELEPGGDSNQEYTFYIPSGRFDLLKVHVDACFAKDADSTIPATLQYRHGGVTGVRCGALHIEFDVGSLDLRK